MGVVRLHITEGKFCVMELGWLILLAGYSREKVDFVYFKLRASCSESTRHV